ncbi:MAG TPA: fasciclin domain-containing protein, partial [Actinomycetota bacterium]|nr:fasciclin domain-containing protein [Actinomycetota bacterium]
ETGGAAAPAPFGAACAEMPAEGAGSFEGMMTQPVVTAAGENPLLTSLVEDLELAGLTDTLNSAEDLTVFAPTNDAFAAAGAADPEGMEAMMADPTGEFAGLLSYHVVEGQIAPDELPGEHETLQGATLTVEGSGDSFTVNGSASVVCGDIHTDNATVYVIDEVLHPPA